MAICSLLAKLGTSDNIDLRDTLAKLADEFDFAKIGRAPARFDGADLRALNRSIIHNLPFEAAQPRLAAIAPEAANPDFWQLVKQNCDIVEDAAKFIPVAFGDIAPVIEDEDRDFIRTAAETLPAGEIDETTWKVWTGVLKTQTGRKGRNLFMPLRKALTGLDHGPDVGALLVLIGRERVLKRLL